jgi:RES domain-containing protein
VTHHAAATVGTSAVWWRPSHRIIPSRFPPIDLFERVADPADLDAVYAVEALTNPRLRESVGALQAVPPHDRVTGPGAGFIMAPFTHLSAEGARFSTGAFGAYYAAHSRATAIAETVYHRERFLRATAQPAMELTMRVLLATVRGELLDLRGARSSHAALYHPTDYAASQAFAAAQRAQGAAGVVYDSVRDATGECVALWRPRLVTSCRQGAHLGYVWDGTRITAVYEKSKLRAL